MTPPDTRRKRSRIQFAPIQNKETHSEIDTIIAILDLYSAANSCKRPSILGKVAALGYDVIEPMLRSSQ
jgi:hypothetical protein